MHQDGHLLVRFVPAGDKDYIEYTWQGSCKDRIFRPVEDSDIERYPQVWAAYSAARTREPVTGTPLDRVPGLTPEHQVTLRLKGVSNVEGLASLDDYAAAGLGGNGVMWRDVAKLVLGTSATVAKPAAKPTLTAPERKAA